MPRTRTLTEMQAECRQRTEQEGSQFVSDNELGRYLNQSCAKLWGKLVRARGDQYYKTSVNQVVDSVNATFVLPDDFFKLVGIDVAIDGRVRTLHPLDWSRRADYLSSPVPWTYEGPLAYDIAGPGVSFYPTPQAARLVTLWYVPWSPILGDDVFDGINGWEHYAILDTCIAMLSKEESDTRDLRLERDDMEARIDELSSTRDDGAPARVQDRYRGRRALGRR